LAPAAARSPISTKLFRPDLPDGICWSELPASGCTTRHGRICGRHGRFVVVLGYNCA
jgi:hypothetical protein